MATQIPAHSSSARWLLAALAVPLLFAACDSMLQSSTGPANPVRSETSAGRSAAVVHQILAAHHREVLTRGGPGEVTYLWVILNGRAEREKSKVSSTPPHFDETQGFLALRTQMFPEEASWRGWRAGGRRFEAGVLGPDAVEVLWFQRRPPGADAADFLPPPTVPEPSVTRR